jgi:hypothetical protein
MTASGEGRRLERLFVDRRFRLPRLWSNRVLRQLGGSFHGEVVNVSAWDDRDKEGGFYREYFPGATGYHLTNFSGTRGFAGQTNEHLVDLTGELPDELRGRFDVAFNHTTLEHIYEVRSAFRNLCELSRDVVIVVVPFSQAQHESDSYRDYWRFTPTALRMLFEENGLEVVYEAESDSRRAAVYLLAVGARDAHRWQAVLPQPRRIHDAGGWIGASRVNDLYDKLRRRVAREAGDEGLGSP